MALVNRRSGFTLIELLVVVAIIAVLVAILLPALESARGQARAVACMSNQRQLATAFAGYAGDHYGYFPTTGGPDNNSPHWHNTWINLLSEPYLQTGAWDGGLWPMPRADYSSPNAYRGLRQPSVWVCPSAAAWENGDGTYTVPTCGVNRYLTGWYSSDRRMTPYQIHELAEPSRTPLLFDCDSIFGGYPHHVLEANGFHRFAHFDNHGDNFLFADGHVAWIPSLEPDPADLTGTMMAYVYAAEYFIQDWSFWW